MFTSQVNFPSLCRKEGMQEWKYNLILKGKQHCRSIYERNISVEIGHEKFTGLSNYNFSVFPTLSL
jgi:hypothetical protein